MGLNYNPTIVPDGLVMYMDITNSRSYSGSGNTVYNLVNGGIAGTIITGITYDNDNKKNLNFNGSSGYMFSNDTSMNFGTNDFTIQTTLKLNGLSNGFNGAFGSVICAGAALTNNSSIFYVSGTATSHYGLGLYHEPTLLNIIKSYNFQTNKIYNVTVTKNTSQIEFFVDGASIGTSSSSNSHNFTANGFAIGRWFAAGSEQYLKGNIYDFKAYNRALSNQEIAQNYDASKGRYITPENIVTNGLILNLDSGKSNSYSGVGNTIYDLSGFGNTGTLTNGPTFSGLNGGAIVFDGVDDYVISSVNSGISGTASRSICAWAKFNNISSSVVCGIGDAAVDNNLFELQAYQNKMIGHPFGSAIFSQTTLSTGVWYFAAYTYDGTACKLYLNGILEASENRVLTTINTPFSIGKKGFNLNSNMNGSISNAQLYNRALTSQEVLQNYNATKSRFGL